MKLPLFTRSLAERRRPPLASRLSLAFALVWILIVALLTHNGKRAFFDIDPTSLRHDEGCAYVTMLPYAPKHRSLFEYAPDTSESNTASSLVLMEDDKPIGKSHSLHDLIRGLGGGQYSHWYGELFFSASDCTDPRNNGRRYSISLEPSLRTWAKISMFVAFLLAYFVSMHLYGERLAKVRCVATLRSCLDFTLVPKALKVGRGGWLLGVAILVWIGAAAFLLESWSAGRSFDLATGSAYQFSDAYGYWICGNEILNAHLAASHLSEWCQRRLIYPTMLSGILWFSDQNIHQTLLIQAAFLCLILTIVARRSIGIVGLAGGVSMLALLFYYATFDAFPMTMTENAGLMFGALALSSLLLACERRSLPWTALGLALLSVALSARAGALFSLPLLLIWVLIVARFWEKPMLRWLLVTLIASATGFLLQMVLVRLSGGTPAGSYGSFAYVLYGLSVGGAGWTQVLTDHPHLAALSDSAMAQAIYQLAFANIFHNPDLLLAGLYKGWHIFSVEGTYGYQRFGSLAPAFNALWWIGGGLLVRRWRDPKCLLLLVFACGTLLSVPLLRADGGPRVFAATMAPDVLQITIGAWFSGMVLLNGIRHFFWQDHQCAPEDRPLEEMKRPGFTAEGIATGLLVFLIVTALVLPSLPGNAAMPIKGRLRHCVGNDYFVEATIGYAGTYLLDMVESPAPVQLKGEVQETPLLRGIPDKAWWWTPPPPNTVKSLLTVYPAQVAASPLYAGANIYSEEHLAPYFGKKVGICFSGTETVTVFGNIYRKLISINAL